MTIDQHDATGANPQDISHLNVLAILHYIWGGLGLAGAMVGLLIVPFGLAMLDGEIFGERDREFQAIGTLLAIAGGVSFCCSGIPGALNIYTGRCLHGRRNRTLCFVVSGINCLLGGLLGIALGVFTIIVLCRQSVKKLFEAVEGIHGAPGPRPPGP